MILRSGGRTVWSSLRWTATCILASAQVETRLRLERTVLGYCGECRKKVEIQNPKRITLKSSRPAVKHVCPKCGTKVFLIGEA